MSEFRRKTHTRTHARAPCGGAARSPCRLVCGGVVGSWCFCPAHGPHAHRTNTYANTLVRVKPWRMSLKTVCPHLHSSSHPTTRRRRRFHTYGVCAFRELRTHMAAQSLRTCVYCGVRYTRSSVRPLRCAQTLAHAPQFASGAHGTWKVEQQRSTHTHADSCAIITSTPCTSACVCCICAHFLLYILFLLWWLWAVGAYTLTKPPCALCVCASRTRPTGGVCVGLVLVLLATAAVGSAQLEQSETTTAQRAQTQHGRETRRRALCVRTYMLRARAARLSSHSARSVYK